ncbi:1-phosphofructokinase [uncultured Pseudodesulfovibrio sp.]|uniref:1-phosphofructokinase n=1 Tax=uncultured Pseudodesulfovibrio sp. TaxID=2035858 RepID=UPI0029C69638|nr:1-phosphofructokinase [uncultured Pseudodesulfovibrio sp.]
MQNKGKRIVTVTMNPAIDLACTVPGFAAGAVNRVAGYQSDAAGKGVNIAGLLRKFDLPVTVSGFLGTENARIFEKRFADLGMTDEFVRVPGETRIGIKVLDPESKSTTDINFPGLAPDAKHMDRLAEIIEQLSIEAGIVVIAGSLPVGVAPDSVGRLIRIIKDQGAKAVVDTSGPALAAAVEAGPWLIKPNDAELAELVGRPMDSLDDMVAEARRMNASGIATVAVSLGARGAVFVEDGQAMLSQPPKIEAVSTVGAGDAMIGGLVAGMALGLPLKERVRMATALSAATVMQAGPALHDLNTAKTLEPRIAITTFQGGG